MLWCPHDFDVFHAIWRALPSDQASKQEAEKSKKQETGLILMGKIAKSDEPSCNNSDRCMYVYIYIYMGMSQIRNAPSSLFLVKKEKLGAFNYGTPILRHSHIYI